MKDRDIRKKIFMSMFIGIFILILCLPIFQMCFTIFPLGDFTERREKNVRPLFDFNLSTEYSVHGIMEKIFQ